MHTQKIIRESSDNIEKLARLGFVTRGVVYGTIGVLAAKLALGHGGRTTDPRGAINTLGSQPFGQFLLIILAAGFAGYAFWRILQGILDTEKKGNKPEGLAKRVSYIIIGIINAGFSLTSVKILMHSNPHHQDTYKTMSAKLMSQPMGLWLVGLAGIVVIGMGIYQFYKAYSEKYKEKIKSEEMSATEMSIFTKAATMGLSARGIVFCIIGYFLIMAAIKENPNNSRGLAGALHALIEQPYGPWLLAVVSLGFILYGAFSILNARFYRIHII